MANTAVQSVALPAAAAARRLLADSSPPVPPPLASPTSALSSGQLDLRQAFRAFTAGTFYREMIKALRKTQHKPAYFHGGMAEDIFQAHLDQTVAESLAEKSGDQWVGPLFDAFAQRLRLNLNQPHS